MYKDSLNCRKKCHRERRKGISFNKASTEVNVKIIRQTSITGVFVTSFSCHLKTSQINYELFECPNKRDSIQSWLDKNIWEVCQSKYRVYSHKAEYSTTVLNKFLTIELKFSDTPNHQYLC